MKISAKLVDHLRRLTRQELEDLSEKVCGVRNSSLKNKDEVINCLTNDPQCVIKVAKELGFHENWWHRHSVHLYGIVGVIAAILTAIPLLQSMMNSTGSGSNVSGIDDMNRRDVLARIEYIKSIPLDDGIQTEPIHRTPDSAPTPTQSGFKLLEYTVECDLRRWHQVDSVEYGDILKASPVVQAVRQTLINTDGADKYYLRAHTSGLDVFSHSTTHQGVNDGGTHFFTVHESNEVFIIGGNKGELEDTGGYKVKQRILEFDVSEDPKDREFDIHVFKTYWNAFQHPDQSWAGLVVDIDTEYIRYLLVFPDDKPYTSYVFFANDDQVHRTDLPAEDYILEDEKKHWLCWYIQNPKVGHSYNIDWEW